MKRRLRIIAICLLLGGVVNVAVAWVVALSGRPTAGPVFTIAEKAEAEAVWGRYAKKEWPSAPVGFGQRKERGQGWEAVILTGTHRVRRFGWSCDQLKTSRTLWEGQELDSGRFEKATVNEWFVMEVRSGWPVHSLRGASYQGGTRADMGTENVFMITVGTIWAYPPPVTRVPDRRLIPYEPLWGGLVINTLFYAAVLWLLICGPFALRRFLRVRRGLCPKCAYPTGESSVCTECGGALAKHAVA